MSNKKVILVEPKEIEKRFGIPYHTVRNWAIDLEKGNLTWRAQHYDFLQKFYIKEKAEKLAKQVEELSITPTLKGEA